MIDDDTRKVFAYPGGKAFLRDQSQAPDAQWWHVELWDGGLIVSGHNADRTRRDRLHLGRIGEQILVSPEEPAEFSGHCPVEFAALAPLKAAAERLAEHGFPIGSLPPFAISTRQAREFLGLMRVPILGPLPSSGRANFFGIRVVWSADLDAELG